MQNESNIKAKVLEKIHKGNIRKRPKAYFIAQITLIVILSMFAIILSVFVLSFVIFSMHESGVQFLLGFGQRGILAFFALFPWGILILDLLLFVVIDWLFRYFEFGYRIPVLRVFFGTIALAVIGSVIIDVTPLHSILLEKADHGRLPVIGQWYKTIRASHSDQGVFRGTISSIQGSDFVISHNDNDYDADDGTWTVISPPGLRLADFNIGDKVYVAGDAAKGIIQAYGVEKLSGL